MTLPAVPTAKPSVPGVPTTFPTGHPSSSR
jgi:hypothetical protein